MVGNEVFKQSPVKLGDCLDRAEIERQAMMMYGGHVVLADEEQAHLLGQLQQSSAPALAPFGLQPVEMVAEPLPAGSSLPTHVIE